MLRKQSTSVLLLDFYYKDFYPKNYEMLNQLY